MNMKYTKGTWRITPNGEYVGVLSPSKPICKICDRGSSEGMANAELISLAPELAESMSEMLTTLSEQLTEDACENTSIIEAFNKCAKLMEKITGNLQEL